MITDEDFFQYERLIHSVVRKIGSYEHKLGLDYEDLFQVGCIGLIKAFKGFDPSRGFTFTTYAVPMITGEILRELRDYGGIIKMSRAAQSVARMIRKNGMEKHDAKQIAEHFDITPRMAELAQHTLNMDKKVRSLNENIKAQDTKQPIELIETVADYDDEFESEWRLFTSDLSERENMVIQKTLYGFLQREISEELGVSQVQVSRDLKKIKAKYAQYSA